MDILSTITDALQNINHSKKDISGTDPNRYASHHTVAEATLLSHSKDNEICNSLISGLPANVGKLERILMVAAGGYLLYKAFTGPQKNIAQGIAGGTMLARGVSGYCPIYDAVGKMTATEQQ